MGWFGLFGVGVLGTLSWLFRTNVSFIVVRLWEITMMHMEHYIFVKGSNCCGCCCIEPLTG